MTDKTELTLVDRDSFRQAMRAIASSVTVITTCHEGHPHGMTATAFSSVTADPPTVLIVVNRTTRSHPLIAGSKAFVVNVLAESQRHLGEFFSGKEPDQFVAVEHRPGRNNAPILAGAAAYLDCEILSETVCGTHAIFLAHVVEAAASQEVPLLYHDGQYKTVAAA